MSEMTAYEIVRKAGEAFDAWRAANEEEIADLDLLEQIDRYAADAAWHQSH